MVERRRLRNREAKKEQKIEWLNKLKNEMIGEREGTKEERTNELKKERMQVYLQYRTVQKPFNEFFIWFY
jgi:protein subunit release factor B